MNHKTLKVYKVIMTGAVFTFLAYEFSHIIRITHDPIYKNVWEEIPNWIFIAVIFLTPLLLIYRKKEIQAKALSIALWTWMALFFLAEVNSFVADDPLASGLPFVVIVIPYTAILTIVFAYQEIRARINQVN